MKLLWQISAICALSSVLCAQAPGPPRPAAFAPPDATKPSSTAFHIAGTVVDQSGQPVAGIRVAAGSALKNEDSPTVVITSEEGRFQIEGLHAGKYTLLAQWRGEFQVYDAHGEFATAIAVGPGLDPGDLIFRLRPRSAISGRVTDEHNEPVRNAMVKLYSQEDGTSAFTSPTETSTDDEGVFRFGHLAPGRYCLLALAEPWYAKELAHSEDDDSEEAPAESPLNVVYPATYYPGGAAANTESPIVLGPGEKVTADISLQPVPALSVRLAVPDVDSDHLPGVSLVQELLADETEDVTPHVRPVAPGVLEVSGLRPGHYQVEISVPKSQGDTQEQSMIHRSMDVSMNGGAAVAEEHAAVHVRGLAKMDNGASVPEDGILVLKRFETHLFFAAVISSKGEFEFDEDVSPGSYELSSQTEDLFLKSVKAAGAKVRGSTIEVDGISAVNLMVTLTQGVGVVNGTALKDGKPVAGAMILLVPTDAANNFSLFRRDQSDSDGSFTLRDAVTGKYTVLALENGWDLEWSNPEVLKPFMAGGTAVQVRSKETLDVKVNVQMAGGTQ